MNVTELKLKRRIRRKAHVRKTVSGTSERPRLTIFRSLAHIYAQVIDDSAGTTLASSSTVQIRKRGTALKSGGNKAAAVLVGTDIAEQAKTKGVSKVVFDRNGYRYHGRIKALADAARKGGLSF
jgi:large subunit ribosomal protein L18